MSRNIRRILDKENFLLLDKENFLQLVRFKWGSNRFKHFYKFRSFRSQRQQHKKPNPIPRVERHNRFTSASHTHMEYVYSRMLDDVLRSFCVFCSTWKELEETYTSREVTRSELEEWSGGIDLKLKRNFRKETWRYGVNENMKKLMELGKESSQQLFGSCPRLPISPR